MPRDDGSVGNNGVADDKDDPAKAASSIFVLVRDPTTEVTNTDIHELFSQWGEVKEVRDGRGKTVVYV